MVKHLIIGTKNKAKLGQLKSVLGQLGIDVQGLPDYNFSEIIEDGLTALENARRKAIYYSDVLGQPVLSTDNALYFNNLSVENQPGVKVRHFSGRLDRPTDTESLNYYAKLVASLGGKATAHWEYGICLAYPSGQIEEVIIQSPRIFVSQPSPKIIDGYPLESLQIDPLTGQYISEMSVEQKDEFWQRTIGKELSAFIKKSIFFQTP